MPKILATFFHSHYWRYWGRPTSSAINGRSEYKYKLEIQYNPKQELCMGKECKRKLLARQHCAIPQLRAQPVWLTGSPTFQA